MTFLQITLDGRPLKEADLPGVSTSTLRRWESKGWIRVERVINSWSRLARAGFRALR